MRIRLKLKPKLKIYTPKDESQDFYIRLEEAWKQAYKEKLEFEQLKAAVTKRYFDGSA